MKSIQNFSSNPMLREYAQGAAQNAIQPVADFLAPTVPVSTMTGQFKTYSEKNRFRIPNTLRSTGGRAVELGFDAADDTFNCKPHALDFPVDLTINDEKELEDVVREGAISVAEVGALAHEKTVIDKALAAAGSGTAKVWNSSADPVDDIDAAILAVVKAARYGSLMGVGVLFGATAWKIFKNASAVKSRFIAGGTKANKDGVAVPTIDNVGSLFCANPDVKSSYMVYDDAPEGKDADIKFVLDTNVLIFARKSAPTRRDPSFMKTFRLMNKFMVPGSYERDDGRVTVAKFDWSEDVRVTNSAAVQRLNISAS